MSVKTKKWKDLEVTIQMNGRKSARKRRISLPKLEIPKASIPIVILTPAKTKCFKDVSTKIDNKGLRSPSRSPKHIQGMLEKKSFLHNPLNFQLTNHYQIFKM